MMVPRFLRSRFFLFEGATGGVFGTPVRLTLAPSPWYGWFIVGAGLLVSCFAFAMLLMAPRHLSGGNDLIWMVPLAAIAVCGVAALFVALTYLRARLEIDFGETSLRVRERGLHGWHEWSAPYADFLGVRDRETFFARPYGRRMKFETWQLLELVHRDPARTVPLHAHEGTLPPRRAWERTARELNLPAIGDGPRGPVFRPPESLNRSLAERVALGEVVARPPRQPPPRGLRLARRESPVGPRVSLLLRRSRLPYRNQVFLLLFMVAFASMIVSAFDDGVLIVREAAGALLPLCLLLAFAVVDRILPRTLVLEPESIRSEEPLSSFRHGYPERVAYDEIEDVRLVTKTGRITGLAIETDRGRILTGQGLRDHELGWLYDFLVAEITARQG